MEHEHADGGEAQYDVSVVMPSYNSADFIHRSVGSVLEQTGVSCELIVVDDEGSDDTRPMLEKIKADHPQAAISLIYRPGGLGQATARNEGMKKARGRYIAFLDSDDAFHEETTLAQWVSFADRLGVDVACAQYLTVRQNSEERRPSRAINVPEDKVISVRAEPGLVNTTSCWQVLYRRKFLEETNTIFSPKLRQREDRLFLIQALLATDKIAYTAQFVVDHFDMPNSSFKKINQHQFEQFLQHVRELNEIIKKARENGRSSAEFETANCQVYFIQLIRYWKGIFTHLADDEETVALAQALCAEYKKLSEHAGVFFKSGILKVTAEPEDLTLEGEIDVLRLAIQAEEFELIKKLVQRERLFFPELRKLAKEGGDAAEEIVTRYLSFHRDWKGKKSAEIVGSRPLRALVKKIVLHVGPPKTGSSSLQQSLERNRLSLIEQGIHYPVTGANRERRLRRERTPGHARLFQRILDDDPSALLALCGELEVIEGDIDTLILSAENILSTRFWDNGNGYRKIVEALDVDHIEVVCAFRRQDEWLRSAYYEMCANPWNNFVEYPEKFISDVEQQGLFDYRGIEAELQRPDCVKAVHVGCFEAIRNEGGIIPWFCGIIGLEAERLSEIESRLSNDSLQPSQVALVRFFKSFQGLSRNELTDAFLAVLGTPVQKGVNHYLLPEQLLNDFREKHAAEIDYYGERFGQPKTDRATSAEPQAELHIPPALYHAFVAQRLAVQHSLEMEKDVSFLTKQEITSICSLSNRNYVIRMSNELNDIRIGITCGPEEEILSFKVATQKQVDLTEEVELRSEGAYKYIQFDRELLDHVFARGHNQIDISFITPARTGHRQFMLKRWRDRVTLLPPDWEALKEYDVEKASAEVPAPVLEPVVQGNELVDFMSRLPARLKRKVRSLLA